MIYKFSLHSRNSNGYPGLIRPVLPTTRTTNLVIGILYYVTQLTPLLARRTVLQAAAICGVVILFNVVEVRAQASTPGAYERGIWYDISGIGKDSLGPIHNEVDKLYNQGVQRVHIMVSESIFQKALRCDCTHDNKVSFFTYRNLNPDVKSEITREYHSCLNEQISTNKWCENARNYGFEFDKWGGFELYKHRRVRSKFYRLGLLIDQLNKKNIDVIITIWPEPNSQYINSLSNLVRYIISSKHSIYGIELEDEENWSEVFTKNGSKQELDEAARDLVAKLRNELPKSIKIGVTVAGRGGFLVRSKFTNDALLTNPYVDFISFQAYQDTLTGKTCDPSKISGNVSPSSLADHAITLVSSTDKLNSKNLILGLSAYQLDCPPRPNATGLTGTVNMYIAAKKSICAAEAHGNEAKAKIIGDSYYSEANVVFQRDKGNFYAHNFLSLCQIDSIRKHCADRPAVSYNADGDGDRKVLSELDRDCPNIIKDLANKAVVTPGETTAREREIYIHRHANQ